MRRSFLVASDTKSQQWGESLGSPREITFYLDTPASTGAIFSRANKQTFSHALKFERVRKKPVHATSCVQGRKSSQVFGDEMKFRSIHRAARIVILPAQAFSQSPCFVITYRYYRTLLFEYFAFEQGRLFFCVENLRICRFLHCSRFCSFVKGCLSPLISYPCELLTILVRNFHKFIWIHSTINEVLYFILNLSLLLYWNY